MLSVFSKKIVEARYNIVLLFFGGGGEKGRETKLTCLRIEALYLFSILLLLFVTTCNALVMISSLIGTVIEVPQAQRSKTTYQTIENKQLNSFFQKVKAFI